MRLKPFGAVAYLDEDVDGDGESFVLNLRRPGQWFDAETGLYYNWFRYYDSEVGRYLRVSTPNEVSNFMGIWELYNHYHYTWNNPVNFIDLNGLYSIWARYLFRFIYIQDSSILVSDNPDAPYHLLVPGVHPRVPYLPVRYPAHCWQSVRNMMKCYYRFHIHSEGKGRLGWRWQPPFCPVWQGFAVHYCKKYWNTFYRDRKFKNWLECYLWFLTRHQLEEPNPFYPFPEVDIRDWEPIMWW